MPRCLSRNNISLSFNHKAFWIPSHLLAFSSLVDHTNSGKRKVLGSTPRRRTLISFFRVCLFHSLNNTLFSISNRFCVIEMCPNVLSPVFNMAKFTTLGATGRLGPTSVGMHYQGQDHEGQVTVNKGIQMWKVPATGMYTIEATGAAGGYDKFTSCE